MISIRTPNELLGQTLLKNQINSVKNVVRYRGSLLATRESRRGIAYVFVSLVLLVLANKEDEKLAYYY